WIPACAGISAGRCKLLGSSRHPLMGLLQVQHECNATAVESSLAKSDRTRESLDRRAPLEMGIENQLAHGPDASRLPGVEDLAYRRFPIRNVAQDRQQQRSIEPIAAEFAFPQPAFEKSNIGEVCGGCLFPRSLENPGLNIHGDDFALRADFAGDRNGKPA